MTGKNKTLRRGDLGRAPYLQALKAAFFIRQTSTLVMAVYAMILIASGRAWAVEPEDRGVDTLLVPAFTAYLEPDSGGARVDSDGIAEWRDPAVKVLWFCEFKVRGAVVCSLAVKLATNETSKFRMTIAGKSREATARGEGTNLAVLKFGSFDIPQAGYQRITLESLNAKGQPAGRVQSLILEGNAIRNAHFNLKRRRNAASVHLFYPSPADSEVAAFYCEVTGVEDPLWTYYMACGWHRGYLGMQVNSPSERRIIFSVWDSGNEANDRSKVAQADRVQLVAKGEGVVADGFGGEGTGGHSHLVYPWKTGDKQRFLVTAKPVDPTHTVYSGFYFHPEQRKWMLISSWRTPQDGGRLRGLYSFSENFGEGNGHLRRKALFGNQWSCGANGQWLELTEARFSHDETGKADRLDRFTGVEDGQFFLSQGGFLAGFTPYGEVFTRKPTGMPPVDCSRLNGGSDASADAKIRAEFFKEARPAISNLLGEVETRVGQKMIFMEARDDEPVAARCIYDVERHEPQIVLRKGWADVDVAHELLHMSLDLVEGYGMLAWRRDVARTDAVLEAFGRVQTYVKDEVVHARLLKMGLKLEGEVIRPALFDSVYRNASCYLAEGRDRANDGMAHLDKLGYGVLCRVCFLLQAELLLKNYRENILADRVALVEKFIKAVRAHRPEESTRADQVMEFFNKNDVQTREGLDAILSAWVKLENLDKLVGVTHYVREPNSTYTLPFPK